MSKVEVKSGKLQFKEAMLGILTLYIFLITLLPILFVGVVFSISELFVERLKDWGTIDR